jgi:hypothetical protein
VVKSFFHFSDLHSSLPDDVLFRVCYYAHFSCNYLGDTKVILKAYPDDTRAGIF